MVVHVCQSQQAAVADMSDVEQGQEVVDTANLSDQPPDRRRSVSESGDGTDAAAAIKPVDASRRSETEPGDLQNLSASIQTSVLDDSTLLLDEAAAAEPQPPKRQHNEQQPGTSETTEPTTQPEPALGCEMCSNYEIRLQQLQEIERTHKHQLSVAQTLADRYHTELSAERLLRGELEAKMAELSQQNDARCDKLLGATNTTNESVSVAEQTFEAQLEHLQKELRLVTEHRRHAEQLVQNMQHKYLALLGTHRQTSSAMQEESIELPQDTDGLQLKCLTLREELIETRAAKEHLQQAMQSDVAFLRDQVVEEQQEREQVEANLTEEINGLRTELAIARSQTSQLKHLDDVKRQVAEYQTTIDDLETKLSHVQSEKGEMEFELRETQKKQKKLQQDLDAGEAVQMDFVKLSQSLQIELEKIRQAEQEVRWQFDEDVYSCNGCQMSFQRSQQKLHCRHCGRVFCDECLPKTVHAGPQHRPARVCQICHTLLCRTERPYFSEGAPNPEPALSRAS